jgi:hypothetical protein
VPVALRRRRLPHLKVVGRPLFIAFRWHDSLPAQRPFPASNPTSGEAFFAMDRWLDRARCGPTFLRQPAMALLVPTSIQYGAEIGHYEVHLLLNPRASVRRPPRNEPTCCFSGAANRFGKTRAMIVWFATVMSSGASNDTLKATR